MSELNEKVGESQGHASEHRSTREIPQDELKKILEAHKKWILSDRKVGERANLSEANLFGADLRGADLSRAILQGANLEGGVQYLTASQVKTAKNWEEAFYSDDFLKELGLPPDHNERVKKKLAELEKEKKATGAKP